MAITFGTSLLSNSASANSITFSSFDATGYDMLVVGAGDRVAATSCVFNTSENFTALTGASGTSKAARHFYLRNPTATTASVVVSFTSTGSVGAIITPLSGTSSTVTASVTGVSSTNGTTATTSSLTSTSGDTCMIFCSHGNQGMNTFTSCGNPTGGTIRYQGGSSNQLGTGSFTTTGTDTPTFTNSGSSIWAISAFAITPSSSSGQISSVNGVAKSSISSFNGVAIASISSLNGVSNV